ncbi:MAG: RDD family protein [Fluviicola sp.]
MNNLLFRRLLAYAIDYAIIALYALILFGMAKMIGLGKEPLSPVYAQLLGFATLTLPVFLYFYLSEKSKSRGTLGKRVVKIAVVCNETNNGRHILLRNVLKFLPWEIAHTGVHWVMYYSKYDIQPPIWVWTLLLFPQFIVLGYLISMAIARGKRSIYDKVARTEIRMQV